MFSQMIKDGMKRIREEDAFSQDNFIEVICEKVRHMNTKVIYDFDGFFVPNDDYMKHFFGPLILERSLDCYNEFGQCFWLGYLVFPIYNQINEVVGLVGFNPVNKARAIEENDWSLQYYRHSGKSLFDKGKHIFMRKGTFEKALEDGYIVLSDGVFDTVSLTEAGINSGALLGSYISEELIAMLTFVDRVYLAVDNDEAGEKLLNQLKKRLPQAMAIRQGKFKDADDVLQSKYSEKYLLKIKQHTKLKVKYDLVIKM